LVEPIAQFAMHWKASDNLTNDDKYFLEECPSKPNEGVGNILSKEIHILVALQTLELFCAIPPTYL